MDYYKYKDLNLEEVEFLIKHIEILENINSGQWNDKNISSDSGDYIMKDLRHHFEDSLNTLYGIRDMITELKKDINSNCPHCGENYDDFMEEYNYTINSVQNAPTINGYPKWIFNCMCKVYRFNYTEDNKNDKKY